MDDKEKNGIAAMNLNGRRGWFHTHRFGLFLHWGLYAIHGLHEQEQQRYHVPAAEYEKLIREFNPRAFSPARWLDLAQDAGMSYLVFTVKHHDGFCLWNTAQTDYNVMHTPFGRDILAELADECHRRNFPLELYYSCVDWHHPAYPNLGRHHEILTDPARHNMDEYMEYLKRQIRELCTNYGAIHGIWWDMNVPKLVDRSVNAMIRALQPTAVINNRGYDEGDYSTPERDYDPENANPDAGKAYVRPTEACQSIGTTSWGYRPDDDLFTPEYFMREIDRNLAMDGNYLLNAGPDPDGIISREQTAVIREVGTWFRAIREAFSSGAEPIAFGDRKLFGFRMKDRIYVHCPYGLDSSGLFLAPLLDVPKRVTLLNTGSEIAFTNEETPYTLGAGPILRLRGIPRNIACPVFRIDL